MLDPFSEERGELFTIMMSHDELLRKARQWRYNPTPSERLALLRLKEAGYKKSDYVFQQVFGFYVLDLFFPRKCLVIEIDGDVHDRKQLHDSRRDQFINQCGLRVVRMRNFEVNLIADALDKNRDFSNWEQHTKKAFAIAKERAEAARNPKLAPDPLDRLFAQSKKRHADKTKDTWRRLPPMSDYLENL